MQCSEVGEWLFHSRRVQSHWATRRSRSDRSHHNCDNISKSSGPAVLHTLGCCTRVTRAFHTGWLDGPPRMVCHDDIGVRGSVHPAVQFGNLWRIVGTVGADREAGDAPFCQKGYHRARHIHEVAHTHCRGVLGGAWAQERIVYTASQCARGARSYRFCEDCRGDVHNSTASAFCSEHPPVH